MKYRTYRKSTPLVIPPRKKVIKASRKSARVIIIKQFIARAGPRNLHENRRREIPEDPRDV